MAETDTKGKPSIKTLWQERTSIGNIKVSKGDYSPFLSIGQITTRDQNGSPTKWHNVIFNSSDIYVLEEAMQKFRVAIDEHKAQELDS